MWNWLSGIADSLKTLWQAVTNLPGLIWDKFSSAFENVFAWLSGIDGGIETIFQKLLDIPSLIWEKFKDVFEDITSFFDDVWEWLTNFPDLLLEGIKGIFIPDTNYINEKFHSFLEELKMRFGFDTSAFEYLFSSEAPVTDHETDYNIPGVGNFHLTVLDTSFFYDGVTYFRPFIRGFMVLLLLFYNIRQCIGFFGYDSGVVAGRTDEIKSARKAQKE